MNEILHRLQYVTERVTGLERELTRLKMERGRMLSQIDYLEKELEKKHLSQRELVERYETLKLAKNVRSSADLTKFHEKIDSYLKEIDICLKILGD